MTRKYLRIDGVQIGSVPLIATGNAITTSGPIDLGNSTIAWTSVTNRPTALSEFTNDTNYANVSYVDTSIANLVASAPETLNTLNELALALNSDASFSTTIVNLIGTKADAGSLSNVAYSGYYADLLNIPTLVTNVALSGANVQVSFSDTTVTDLGSILGYTGSAGYVGLDGATGPTGYTGSQGDIGYTGSKGADGFVGAQGATGPTGYVGSEGAQGTIGYTGSEGVQGLTGATGPQGIQGSIGYTGSEGIQGAQGYTGSQGLTGATGPQGDQGIQGNIGYTGSQGATGSQGNIGYTGSEGIQGTTGPNGATGPQGIQGNIGYTGSEGIQGATGPEGATGPTGLQGDPGINGTNGLDGATGPIGATGLTGATGLQGDPGTPGIAGDTGATGIQGNVGYTGSQGSIGYTGSIGSRGSLWYSGSADPTGALPNIQDNDFYLKTTDDSVWTYGGGTWFNISNISGSIGYTGSAGTNGTNGYTGSQGDAGIQGNIGYTGSAGTNGTIGYTGSQGDQGIQGNVGYTGSSGLQGNIGYTGSQGIQGNIGYTGSMSTIATQIATTGSVSTNSAYYMPFVGANNSTNQTINTASNFTFNPSSGLLTTFKVYVNGTTTSTTTSTGALVVDGGIGVAGNVVANSIYTNSSSINGDVTVSGNVTISGSKAVTMPNRPAFRVYGSTNNTLTTTQNGDGLINGNNYTVDYNQGSHLNTTSGTFTAPFAGLYHVDLVARNSGYTGGISQAVVTVNGNIKLMLEFGSNSSMNHAGVSSIFKLAANDTLQLRVSAGQIQFDNNDSWAVAFIG